MASGDMPVKTESGGMFNSYKVKYSPETHKLLKVLMEEARLTTGQRVQMRECLTKGEPLPAVGKKPRRPTYVEENLFDLKRNYYFLRRGRDQIVRSGAYDRERYRFVKEAVDLEKEKEKLQNIMVYGKTPKKRTNKNEDDPKGKLGPAYNAVTPEERVQELVVEVEERLEFLREMKDLGKAKDYEAIMRQEIAAKLREMEKLDRNGARKYRKCLKLERGDE